MTIIQRMILEREAGGHTIFLEAKSIGKDMLVAIYGGDEHHIGGVSIAHETKSHYRDAETVSVSTLTFPGHKDYVVSSSVAEKICKALGGPVVVTVGIHYDNATPNDIQEIVQVVRNLTDDLIERQQKAE
jgi:alpha-beta hydrolase superfamily lysophospholipase